MTKYEVIDAKPHHVGAILRRMRSGNKAALLSIGVNLHRDLSLVFGDSYFCKAWLADGKLAAVCGLMGMSAESSVHVWVVFSEDAVINHAKMVAKEGKRIIEYALGFHREIVTTVPFGDQAAMRYARYCGFETQFPVAPNGLIAMVRRKKSFQAPMKRSDEEAKKSAPFMIFTAGRSRTVWLSAFLTYADWACFHEIAVHFRNMEQVAGFFRNPRVGTAETAAAPGWRLLRHYLPEMKFVVVRRPVDEIVQSMLAMDNGETATFDPDKLRKRIVYEDRILDQIAEQPGTVSVNFADLEQESVCADLFEHCLPYWFDRGWWESVKARNIQADAAEIFRYYFSHVDEIAAFKRHCKAEMMRLARSNLLSHDGIQ
jgi:hypothetical protein